jgi:hypothetical protein
MEAYDVNMCIDPDQLLLDKIEIVVSGWSVDGTDRQIEEFAGDLNQTENHENPAFGWIFNAATNSRSSGTYSVNIRATGSAPIFAGRMRLMRSTGTTGDWDTRHRYIIDLNLKLNPTRFANYQALEYGDNEVLRLALSAPEIRRRSHREHPNPNLSRFRTREAALYPCDNYVWGPWENAAYLQRNELLQVYIDSALGCINRQIRHSADATGASFSNNDARYNLRNAEAYIDFCLNVPMHPIQFVESLYGALSSYGRRTRIHNFDAHRLEREGGIARHIVFETRNGQQIAVYAKTDQRVRFEVKIDLTQCAGILDDQGRRRVHTTPSLSDLRNWLSIRVPHASAMELNLLFEHLRQTSEVAEIQAPSYLFLGRLAEICGPHTRTILSGLMIDQSIRLERRNSRFAYIVRRLVEECVLERSGRPHNQVYRLTPEYREAIDRLRRLDSIDTRTSPNEL